MTEDWTPLVLTSDELGLLTAGLAVYTWTNTGTPMRIIVE